MRTQGGFTLIELIMVIVLLSIVATVSVQFVAQSTQGAIDTSARQQRALAGTVISAQISRALREALPQSVRINSSGDCIEWMPIVAASNYETLPLDAPASSFEIVPLAADTGTNGRIVVYPYTGDLYTSPPSSPGLVSPGASISGSNVSFDGGASHQFSEESPQRRFYLVGSPLTFCQSGGFLKRYEDYGIQSDVPLSATNTRVLAANISDVSFDSVVPTLQRGAVVAFAFTLTDPQSGETMDFSQEVQVRNVP